MLLKQRKQRKQKWNIPLTFYKRNVLALYKTIPNSLLRPFYFKYKYNLNKNLFIKKSSLINMNSIYLSHLINSFYSNKKFLQLQKYSFITSNNLLLNKNYYLYLIMNKLAADKVSSLNLFIKELYKIHSFFNINKMFKNRMNKKWIIKVKKATKQKKYFNNLLLYKNYISKNLRFNLKFSSKSRIMSKSYPFYRLTFKRRLSKLQFMHMKKKQFFFKLRSIKNISLKKKYLSKVLKRLKASRLLVRRMFFYKKGLNMKLVLKSRKQLTNLYKYKMLTPKYKFLINLKKKNKGQLKKNVYLMTKWLRRSKILNKSTKKISLRKKNIKIFLYFFKSFFFNRQRNLNIYYPRWRKKKIKKNVINSQLKNFKNSLLQSYARKFAIGFFKKHFINLKPTNTNLIKHEALRNIFFKWLVSFIIKQNNLFFNSYNILSTATLQKKFLKKKIRKLTKTVFINVPIKNKTKLIKRIIKKNKKTLFIYSKKNKTNTYKIKKYFNNLKKQTRYFSTNIKKNFHIKHLSKFYWKNKKNKNLKSFWKKQRINSSVLPFWKLLTQNSQYYKNYNRLTNLSISKINSLLKMNSLKDKLKFINVNFYKIDLFKHKKVLLRTNLLQKKLFKNKPKKWFSKQYKKRAKINIFIDSSLSSINFKYYPWISTIKETNNLTNKIKYSIIIVDPIKNVHYYINIKKLTNIIINFININKVNKNLLKFEESNLFKKRAFFIKWDILSENLYKTIFFKTKHIKNLPIIKVKKKNSLPGFKNLQPSFVYNNNKLSIKQRFKKKLKNIHKFLINKKFNSKIFFKLSLKKKKFLKSKYKLNTLKKIKYLKNYDQFKLNFLLSNLNKNTYFFYSLNSLKLIKNKNILLNNAVLLNKLKKSIINQNKKIKLFNKLEQKSFKWRFFNRRWHFSYSRWKRSIMFKKMLRKAWSNYRKIKYNSMFLNLFKVHLNLLFGIKENELWHIWSSVRKGNNKFSSNILKLQQSFYLKFDSLALLLGLTPNRLIAQELILKGGFRLNGVVLTNYNYVMSLNDILQLDLDLNDYIKSLHSKKYWNKIRVRLNFIPYFQVMWSLMMITLLRWPYKYEILEESKMTERWLRFYLRYLPIKKANYKPSKIKWLKY